MRQIKKLTKCKNLFKPLTHLHKRIYRLKLMKIISAQISQGKKYLFFLKILLKNKKDNGNLILNRNLLRINKIH